MLKEKILEHGTSIEAIAKEIKVDPSTFYRRLQQRGSTFEIGEADGIVKVLNLSCEEAMRIFFNQYVA